jgi:hypothetical protein
MKSFIIKFKAGDKKDNIIAAIKKAMESYERE